MSGPVLTDRCLFCENVPYNSGIMDVDPRPFESVNVGLTSVETGRDRFSSNEIFYPPPIAYWRNNLTALSQRYNLYFVATRNSIVVYKPEFPFQKLHRMPCLMILPTLANPNAQGYIDPHSPHDINHLTVGDLGTEEILLLATDSGNVTAYYTKSLEVAIRKIPSPYIPHPRSDHLGVRACFTQWVCESAWGLSIHTHARMIAVSANTAYHVQSGDPSAKITVFAFALTDEEQEEEDVDEKESTDTIFDTTEHTRQPDWYDWETDGSDNFPPPRNKNYKITLAGFDGHDHNIPSISFVNTDQDLEGKWLLSTDIVGMMKIWHIWQGKCLKTWDLAEKRMRSAFFARREGGWLVTALDPRAFRLAETMDEFCGHSKAPQYHGHVGESYDITHIVRVRTPGNSAAFPRPDGSPEEETGDEDDHEAFSLWSDMDQSDVDDDETTLDEFSRRSDPLPPADNSAESSSVFTESEPDERLTMVVEMTSSNMDRGSDQDTTTFAVETTNSASPVPSENLRVDPDSHEGGQEGVSMPGNSSALGSATVVRANNHEVRSETVSAPQTELSTDERQHPGPAHHKSRLKSRAWDARRLQIQNTPPPIPVLHCSASNLRLMIAPEADSAHVFCANVLKQILPREIEQTRHAHLDRLNMMQEIPELGVVIVATQLGRCAICSLTQNEKTDALGLRVDWTLPTHKQEAQRLRPFLPLLGIAASPIQGHLRDDAHTVRCTDDTPVEWGSDGTVDGVPTTFDPSVVVVREFEPQESNTHEQSPDQESGSVDDDGEHKLKRKRLFYSSDTETHARVSTEPSTWQTPPSMERWQSTENSRRYRLMLTYMDMTVLTYEIWRGVERYDVKYEETSTLDLVD